MSEPAEWAMTKAAQICQQIHCMNTEACLTIARALEAADKAAREQVALYIEQRRGSIPDRQEIAAAIRKGEPQ